MKRQSNLGPKEECCERPAKNIEDACCVKDEQAKSSGTAGCRCGSGEETPTTPCC